jgi:hypothetical protein
MAKPVALADVGIRLFLMEYSDTFPTVLSGELSNIIDRDIRNTPIETESVKDKKTGANVYGFTGVNNGEGTIDFYRLVNDGVYAVDGASTYDKLYSTFKKTVGEFNNTDNIFYLADITLVDGTQDTYEGIIVPVSITNVAKTSNGNGILNYQASVVLQGIPQDVSVTYTAAQGTSAETWTVSRINYES